MKSCQIPLGPGQTRLVRLSGVSRRLSFCSPLGYQIASRGIAVLAFKWLWKWKVKGARLCPAFCDAMDYTVHRIFQARILEWEAIPFSRGSSQPRDQTQVSHIVGGFFTSWVTREALSDLIMAPNARVSDAGNSDMSERSCKVLLRSKKMKVLDLIRKDKKSYAEVAEIYRKKGFSVCKAVKRKRNSCLMYGCTSNCRSYGHTAWCMLS